MVSISFIYIYKAIYICELFDFAPEINLLWTYCFPLYYISFFLYPSCFPNRLNFEVLFLKEW